MSIGPNPTAKLDEVNVNLPENEQYPGDDPQPVTIDTNELDLHRRYPEELEVNYTILRCSREKYPTLKEAQAFFGRLRDSSSWRAEAPIFRTARCWVKRVVL